MHTSAIVTGVQEAINVRGGKKGQERGEEDEDTYSAASVVILI